MELLVHINEGHDVAVTADDGHTVGQVAAALARHLDVGPGPWTLSRGSEVFDPDLVVADARLAWGDAVDLAMPERVGADENSPDGFSAVGVSADGVSDGEALTVVSGPDLDRSVALPDRGGETLIVGRDRSCSLVLTDPRLGRQELAIWRDGSGRIRMETASEARGEVRVDGRRATAETELTADAVVTLGVSSLVLRQPLVPGRPATAGGRIPFHRTPYFRRPPPVGELHPITTVPTRPDPPRFGYLASMAPLVIAVAMASLLNAPQYLLFGLFAPVMALTTFIEHKRRSGDAFTTAVSDFENELAEAIEARAEAETAERRARFRLAPDLVEHHRRAATADPQLWVRSRRADDFLQLRVGIGSAPPETRLVLPNGGDEEFRRRMATELAGTDELVDVPITLEVADLGVVGLVGAPGDVDSLAAAMVVQACCWHSPEDLVVAGAVAPTRSFPQWAKWLPHVRSGGSPLAGRHLVTTRTAGDTLIDGLLAVARERSEGNGRFPWLLVVLDQALDLEPTSVSELAELAPEVGMSVLFLASSAEWVPRQAQAVVTCRSPLEDRPSSIHYTEVGRDDDEFVADRLGGDQAAATTRALAPLRDATAAASAASIPRTVDLFSVLGTASIDAAWVGERWSASTADGSRLAAPIGMAEAGPMTVDLTVHGPHGLMGGTSGSGKSELLMSMVAAMMALHPPDKLNFLFVDYKGGASTDVFRHAPHTAGCVTNLDAARATRALISLSAELDRRMRLLSGRAKDMAELRASGADDAAPALVLVFDEFESLKREIPAFVDGVVDIARRGRSLGIHLMLATQKPSGSVDENIRGNANLRIALRMDEAESREVVGSADAAAIPVQQVGRAYINRGDGRLVPFQSAWSGAPLKMEEGASRVLVRDFVPGVEPGAVVTEVAGDHPGGRAGGAGGVGPGDRTQLDVLLDAVGRAAETGRHQRGHSPWLEPLPALLTLSDAFDHDERERLVAGRESRRAGTEVVIGMVDVPERQAQHGAVVDLARGGGLLVTGAPASGKTSALRTLAVSAAVEAGREFTIVALSFGSRQLVDLRHLPQTAAAVSGDNLEAVTRVIDTLGLEFDRRSRAAGDDGAAAGEAGPPILLLVDGLDNMTQMLDQSSHGTGLPAYYDRLVEIIVNGRAVGIHVAATASRRTGLRLNLIGAFTERIVLRQTDKSDYLDAGVDHQLAGQLDLRPGQGLWSGAGRSAASLQLARLAGEREEQEAETVAKIGANLSNASNRVAGGGGLAFTTSPLPTEVRVGSELACSDPLRPPVGVADLTLQPVVLDLTHDNVLVQGEPRSGRSTVLATVASQVAGAGGRVFVVGPSSSPLRSLEGVAGAVFGNPDEAAALLADLTERAKSADVDRPGSTDLLIVDDLDLLTEDDFSLRTVIVAAMAAVRTVVATPKLTGYVADEALQAAKRARTVIYLNPAGPRDAYDVFDMTVPWRPGLPMLSGRGLLMANRTFTTVQFALPG